MTTDPCNRLRSAVVHATLAVHPHANLTLLANIGIDVHDLFTILAIPEVADRLELVQAAITDTRQGDTWTAVSLVQALATARRVTGR